MNIKYNGHTSRQEKARELWLNVATDYAGKIPPKDIAKRYKITREHIYWILRKLKTLTIN